MYHIIWIIIFLSHCSYLFILFCLSCFNKEELETKYSDVDKTKYIIITKSDLLLKDYIDNDVAVYLQYLSHLSNITQLHFSPDTAFIQESLVSMSKMKSLQALLIGTPMQPMLV